jgi:hypothetical protein
MKASASHRNTRLASTASVPLFLTLLALAGCATPAPVPIAVGRVRALWLDPGDARACPGEQIKATYTAVLDDSSFRVIDGANLRALDRTGVNVRPGADGSWDTESEPLISAMTGFHLRAVLHDHPATSADTTVAPTYDCPRKLIGLTANAFNGPAVTVRLSQFRSPYYDSLVVIAVDVEGRPTTYVLLGPAQMTHNSVQLSASGGSGDTGGSRGVGLGCEMGRPGGMGGRFTVYVEAGRQSLLDLIVTTNAGGSGGSGGICYRDSDGKYHSAPSGPPGEDGPPRQVREVPLNELWQSSPTWADDASRKAISALIEYTARRRP